MKTKSKAIKIKNKNLEQEIATRRAFMWKEVERKEINSSTTRVYFQRGPEDFKSKKGIKKVKKLEKWHDQLVKKKAPVAAIIFTLIEVAAVVPIFILKEELFKIILIGFSSVWGAITLFIWIAYFIMLIKKKKLLKYCKAEASKFDAKPQEIIDPKNPKVEVITPIDDSKELTKDDVAEPYMQGDDK